MKNLTTVSIDYESVIKKAFPNAMVIKEGNFDDYYFGWEICPSPGHFIRFNVQMSCEERILIEKSILITWGEGKMVSARYSVIYKGTIPFDSEKMDFDLKFIENILKNYLDIG